jgi:hypothetical protein
MDGWMDVWELNPELGSLWLKASAALGEITSAEDVHVRMRWAVPLFTDTLAFALQLRKSTENLSHDKPTNGSGHRCRTVSIRRDRVASGPIGNASYWPKRNSAR